MSYHQSEPYIVMTIFMLVFLKCIEYSLWNLRGWSIDAVDSEAVPDLWQIPLL